MSVVYYRAPVVAKSTAEMIAFLRVDGMSNGVCLCTSDFWTSSSSLDRWNTYKYSLEMAADYLLQFVTSLTNACSWTNAFWGRQRENNLSVTWLPLSLFDCRACCQSCQGCQINNQVVSVTWNHSYVQPNGSNPCLLILITFLKFASVLAFLVVQNHSTEYTRTR